MDYKKAGVDIEAGYKSVELMKEHVKKTMRPEVLGGLGGFSGAFSLEKIFSFSYHLIMAQRLGGISLWKIRLEAFLLLTEKIRRCHRLSLQISFATTA